MSQYGAAALTRPPAVRVENLQAAAFNHVDELRHLQVIEGREVDAVDIKERTPLMLACKYGALDAVQVNIRSAPGWSSSCGF